MPLVLKSGVISLEAVTANAESAPRCRRVGHKGADLISPGNTAASFDAALECGVDMIEFDVLPLDRDDMQGSPLVLAHDYESPLDGAMTLEEGLAHLADERFAGIELDVDVKYFGYEDRVVDALQRHGMVERTLVSSMYRRSLARFRELEPELRLGWSVPRVRRDYTNHKLLLAPVYLMILRMRRRLIPRAVAAIQDGAIDALMVNFHLLTPALVEAVRGAGGDLYVWTVDDAERIARYERMGVTGVITNDPRLFP